MTITRRQAGLLLGGAAAGLAAPRAFGQAEPAKPARLVVNQSGGAQEAASRRAYYTEFENRTGIKVVTTSPPDFGKLRAMVQSGNIEWNLTELDIDEAIRAQQMGLIEPLDAKIVDRSRFPEAVRNRSHIFTRSVYSTVMGYRTDSWAAGKGPRGWADFWDTAKFPGPRTMQNKPLDNLEFALLADGVARDKLYPLDLDRAFKKLEQIKKHVTVWWKTGAQSAQLLVDKECVLGTAWNGRYYAAVKAGAPIHVEWNQGSIKESAFVIPKGAKDLYWTNRLIAAMTEAKLQAAYAGESSYPGVNLDAVAMVDPKIAPHLPTHPDNLGNQFWMNPEWWAQNAASVEERWNRWLIAK